MELDFDALCATAADSWASCSYPTLPDAHPGVIGAGARRKGKKRLNLDEVLDQTVKLPRLSTGKHGGLEKHRSKGNYEGQQEVVESQEPRPAKKQKKQQQADQPPEAAATPQQHTKQAHRAAERSTGDVEQRAQGLKQPKARGEPQQKAAQQPELPGAAVAANKQQKQGKKLNKADSHQAAPTGSSDAARAGKPKAVKQQQQQQAGPSAGVVSGLDPGPQQQKQAQQQRQPQSKASALATAAPALPANAPGDLGPAPQQQQQQKQQGPSSLLSRQANKPAECAGKAAARSSGGGGGGLLDKMRSHLQGARFRQLNEALYTRSGEEALDMVRREPGLFEQYHTGFQQQTKGWPRQPLDVAIAWLSNKSAQLVVADFGCGDARLAASVPQRTVHSLDLAATAPGVTACNMAHTLLASGSVDVAVFSLSLMGIDYGSYLVEAARVLKPNGWLWIAEVRSRFAAPQADRANANAAAHDEEGEASEAPLLEPFLACLQRLGFRLLQQDASNRMFVTLVLKKGPGGAAPDAGKLPAIKWPALKACLYKKR